MKSLITAITITIAPAALGGGSVGTMGSLRSSTGNLDTARVINLLKTGSSFQLNDGVSFKLVRKVHGEFTLEFNGPTSDDWIESYRVEEMPVDLLDSVGRVGN